jgi:hypothetical protein
MVNTSRLRPARETVPTYSHHWHRAMVAQLCQMPVCVSLLLPSEAQKARGIFFREMDQGFRKVHGKFQYSGAGLFQ